MYGDYIRQIAGSRATLKMVKVRKEQWKSLSKTIQQRHDIAPLSELLASPQYRLGVYVTFFEDYLAAISETEPDYNPAVDTLQHFEECYEDILDNAANASKGELERFGSVVSGLDLCRGDDAQYTKRSYVFRGKADVKSLQDPKYSANYLLLLSDQLVCCQKEKESKSSVRLVNNLYLYDVEVKESPNDSCKFMVSTSGGAEYVFSVQESKEKKQWYFHLKHLIQLRTRRFAFLFFSSFLLFFFSSFLLFFFSSFLLFFISFLLFFSFLSLSFSTQAQTLPQIQNHWCPPPHPHPPQQRQIRPLLHGRGHHHPPRKQTNRRFVPTLWRKAGSCPGYYQS